MQSSAMRKLRGIPGSPSVDLLHAVRCAIGQELNFDSVTIGIASHIWHRKATVVNSGSHRQITIFQ